MNGEKGFKELGPSELDRINKNAFLTFEALFPSMVMPREEITAIVNHELELSRQPSRTTLFGKYEIQELFERIVKEMEFRWNLDERFKPPHWNQRPRIPTIKQDNVPPVNPNDKDDAILSNTKSNDKRGKQSDLNAAVLDAYESFAFEEGIQDQMKKYNDYRVKAQ